jgi:hypothetical protein
LTYDDILNVGEFLDVEEVAPRLEHIMAYFNLTHPADVVNLLIFVADKAISEREGRRETDASR